MTFTQSFYVLDKQGYLLLPSEIQEQGSELNLSQLQALVLVRDFSTWRCAQ